MCLVAAPPFSAVEPVVDVLHGVPISDPYRWLEDQNSPRTRSWIEEQMQYARAYLDAIPDRARIRERVRELLDTETYDSFLKAGSRYFFRKRMPGQEQPCIYLREGLCGEDRLLIDPAARGTGPYTAVRPLYASSNGKLLLYEVKQGGERTGVFELLDVPARQTLPDSLPHGYLRGFAFTPDERSFYYVHEAPSGPRPHYRALFRHTLGAEPRSDEEVFVAGDSEHLRLALISGVRTLGLLVYRLQDGVRTDFYIRGMEPNDRVIPVLRDAQYWFSPRLLPGRIVAALDEKAPNRRIVEVQARTNQNPLYFDLVPETNASIQDWAISSNHIAVSYVEGTHAQLIAFDRFGKPLHDVLPNEFGSVRLAWSSPLEDDLLLERQSFTRPKELLHYNLTSGATTMWSKPAPTLDVQEYLSSEITYHAKDNTSIPMLLVGHREALQQERQPLVMTAYGGFGLCSTPQFSVLVACLLESGCLFALPNIRGGSEFGAAWHQAAKRLRRQTAYDDFLSAVDHLVTTGKTEPRRLAIFGGSNSGLLVAAAMTQRPELFRAVLCIAPILDMLRYHRFDTSQLSNDEFGTADDPAEFEVLAKYSPYHSVRTQTPYPAVLIVSGDADQNCNPLHARKMTARLQAANSADTPILLDYSPLRGHSPVLPLSHRIEALTDRLAFLSQELGLRREGVRR